MGSDFVDKGLKKLIAALKAPPHAEVGIFTGKGARKGGGSTNAQIGAAHEYGTLDPPMPSRSFLRMPINDHLAEEIEKVPKLAKQTFELAAKTGTLDEFLKLLGAAGERVVRFSFTNNGWGNGPS